MNQRYFIESPVVDRQATLDGAEAHHLLHVMRARPGTEVTLFDGSGREWTAQVATTSRSQVELEVLTLQAVDRELACPLVLGIALPKGDRQRWLIEKATELGVTRLVPLVTTRGVAQPTGSAQDRLRRWVVEACKQCGRNRLLEIDRPTKFGDYLEQTSAEALKILAHPDGQLHFPERDEPTRPVYLAVGPEGGWTPEEVALACSANWQNIALGPRILRIETAALLLAAWVQA